MKSAIALLVLSVMSVPALAGRNKMSFSYKDAEVLKVIEDYSSASGQKFVIDAEVKGKVTVFNPDSVTIEEGFNQLSMVLASNGLAISKQGDTMMVSNARNIQRNLIEVTTELPPLKPEKMHTWIINLKHVNADEVNRQLRILTSKNGELVPFTPRNQLIVTDWVSNLYRISAIITNLDKPGRSGGDTPVRKTAGRSKVKDAAASEADE